MEVVVAYFHTIWMDFVFHESKHSLLRDFKLKHKIALHTLQQCSRKPDTAVEFNE